MPRIGNETDGFSFVWRIHNYSYFLKQSNNEVIKSPAFVLNEKDEGKWYVHAFSTGFGNRYDVCLALLRKPAFETHTEIHCEFSVRTIGGLYRKVEESFNGKVQNRGYVFLKVLNRREVFGKGSDAILNLDSLILRCTIWEVDGQPLASRKCNARTILGVKKFTYNVNLENLSNEKTIIDEQVISDEIPSLTINAFFSGDENDNFPGDTIQVKIEQTKTDKPCFTTCEMFLFRTIAEGDIVHSIRSEYRFEISVSSHIWMPSPLSMNKIGGSRNLQFRCEVAVSSFSVQYSFVERVEHGKAEDPPILVFSNFLTDDLQRFLSDGKFSDATIRTTSKDFPVHKAILCARSPVFAAMFERDMKENRNGIVDVEDVDDETISKMLMFVYTDIIEDLDCDVASSLYNAADKFGIIALKRRCSEFLKNNLGTSNVCDVLVLADKHNDSHLKAEGQVFVLKHVAEVMDSAEWKKFMENNSKLASEVMYMVCMMKR